MVFAKGGTGEEKLVGRTYPHVPVIVVPLCVFLFAWVQYCVGVCVCVPVCVGGSAAMKQLPVGLTTLQCWAKETEGENGRGENQLQKAHWLTLITVLSQLKQEQQPQHPDWDSFTQELYLFNV